jgi:hypothetical protein
LLDKGKRDQADSLFLKEPKMNFPGHPNHKLDGLIKQEDQG